MTKKIILLFLLLVLVMAPSALAAESFVYEGVTYSVDVSYSEEEGASNGELSVTAISSTGDAEPVASFTGAELLKHLGYDDLSKEETMVSDALRDATELAITVKKSDSFSSSSSTEGEAAGSIDSGEGFIDEDGLFVTEDVDEGDGTTPAPVKPAAPVEKPITVILYEFYTMEETTVEFPDQKPVIVEGRTLVPARGVFENMGYTVEWDGKTSTASVSNGETKIEIPVGEKNLVVDGDPVEIDVPAQIINDRTMLPLRAISQALGMQVEWDDKTRTVHISY